MYLYKIFTIMKKWTYLACKKEALKFKTRSEFNLNSGSAYNAAKRNKWFNEICSHMISTKKPMKYWTFEKCKEEALKYSTKKDFRQYSSSAYQISKRQKYIKIICQHMIPLGNIKEKIVYIYEFADNHAYVGITCNSNKRHSEHITDSKSPVYKHINKTNLIPIKKILSNGYINYIEAQKLESFYVSKYKNDKWIILNKKKTGALGGNKVYWTFERCQEETLKYTKKSEFRFNCPSAYNVILKNNWLNELCSHMISLQKPTGYWSFERCQEEALKYNTKKDFNKNSCSAYGAASKNKWIRIICSHMHRP